MELICPAGTPAAFREAVDAGALPALAATAR